MPSSPPIASSPVASSPVASSPIASSPVVTWSSGPSPDWSPAQLRLLWREAKQRVREERQGMVLPEGFEDPFMTKTLSATMTKPASAAVQSAPLLGQTYDSRPGTRAHIEKVRRLMARVLADLALRAVHHDRSKLETPEVEHFDRAASRLAGCMYGSAEYSASLADLKPALDHHYAVNSHHPEHHEEGIRGMTLLDLTEMLCDWKAASERHHDGDIRRSIEINQARFSYSDELKQIFLNTLPVLQDGPLKS